jgi:hypothetical protein
MTAVAPAADEPKRKPIRTRERIDNRTLAEVKEYAHGRLGQTNDQPIGGHGARALKITAACADGGPQRWRVFFEWTPVEGREP